MPRDSDLQETTIGIAVTISNHHDYSKLKTGDLVFFPGHVGIFIDDSRFLHANAFDMQVSQHSFSDVLERGMSENSSISSVRRLLPAI